MMKWCDEPTDRRQVNLRVLEITEIKTVPRVPVSHPFIERLIGTIRREYLDRILFWTQMEGNSPIVAEQINRF